MSSATPTVIAGKYEVLGRLGHGGQASVYKVRHVGLGEIRALKLLPDPVGDTDSVARFRREGRALARLRHPHIVQVFDLGRDGDNYYLEMEYVDGPNLAQHLKLHGRPPLHDALVIARQMASALSYAHSQPYEDASGHRQVGLVHRDLKPSNVLLREAGPLHAMLADFGLVKLEDTLGHTAIGTMLGTYRYCAPEQLGLKRAGVTVPVDIRADVFALGLVLYELIEGRQFHAGRQPDEILARVVYDATPLAPEFTVPVPAAIRELVSRMIRRWPDERPQSMAEVLQVLDATLVDEERSDETTVVVPAAPPVPPPRTVPPPGRDEPLATSTTPPVPASGGTVWPRAVLLAGVAVIAAAGAWLLRGGRTGEEPVAPSQRVTAAPPATIGAPSSLPAPAPAPTTLPEVVPTTAVPAAPPTTEPSAAVTTTLAPEPPSILSQRPPAGRPVTLAEGDGVDFSVQASGRGLRYRWLLDGEEVGTKSTWHFVAPAAQAARAPFRVEVEVTGADGTAERPAVWTGEVTWKPPDLRQPVPAGDTKVRVPAGQDQRFRIQATAPRGAGTVRFEWSIDGKPTLRGSEPEFTLQTDELGTHRVEVAAVDGRGAWTTHRWTVEVIAPSTRTIPPVAAMSPTTAPQPTTPPTTLRPSSPTTLPPAPPTTVPGARARADAGAPITDEEMAAWVDRLRRALASKDLTALRALGAISPAEEKPFKKKIANNPDYSVTLWNVSIMIDPRGADVTFDRRDTDDGKVIQQPPRTVRLVRGADGLIVAP